MGCTPVPPPPFYGPNEPGGTIDLPPVTGLGPIIINPTPIIVNGLNGSTIILDGVTLEDITRGQPFSGGTLGGTRQDSLGHLQIHLSGTGAYSTFSRSLTIQIDTAFDAAPHPTGGTSQSFNIDVNSVFGEITGDPDFDLLRITGGTNFGMPSPGHTTLSRVGSGDWLVDSFFDVFFRIDFVGAPGGTFSGLSGSTPGTQHIQIGNPNPTPPPPLGISPGIDLFDTPPNGSTFQDFTPTSPIPAGFFGPGSDPFIGHISFHGGSLNTSPPLPGVDTIVRRNVLANLPTVGSSAGVPIEIVALSLVSIQPITVTYNGGQLPEQWNVSQCLSTSPQQQGTMTITRDYANGGTFSSVLPVRPQFFFSRIGPPATRNFTPTLPTPFNAQGRWTSNPDPALALMNAPPSEMADGDCNGILTPLNFGTSNFFCGILDFGAMCGTIPPAALGHAQVCRLVVEAGANAGHAMLPAHPLFPDIDGDGFADIDDNCPMMPNSNQQDTDGDGWGDVCDNCPSAANACQNNTNLSNSLGDACEVQPACIKAGDLNGDVLVDGRDIRPFVRCLVNGSSPGDNCACADLNGDGVSNLLDVPYMVQLLLGTSDMYIAPINGLPVVVQTDHGPQPTIASGTITLMIGGPIRPGVRPVTIADFTFATPSVVAGDSDTGSISFLSRPGTNVGTWNIQTGQFDLALDFDVSYWLLNQSFPPIRDPDPPGFVGEVDESVYQTEHWTGSMHGTATTDGGGSLVLNTTTTVSNTAPLLPNVITITFNFFGDTITIKIFTLQCTKEVCNKKKMCIQPVFVKDSADDASPTGSALADFKAAATSLWAKCCVELMFMDPITIVCPGGKVIDDIGASSPKMDNLRGKSDPKGENDCVEVFFVTSMSAANGDAHAWGDGDTAGGGTAGASIVVADEADCNPKNDNLLAHELGHAMGMHGHKNAGDTVMKATGHRPDCPGKNPSKVSKTQCAALKNPLLKEKDPKEQCCKNYDE